MAPVIVRVEDSILAIPKSTTWICPPLAVEDVGRLDIPMHHVPAMGIVQGLEELLRDGQHLREGESVAAFEDVL